MVRKKHTFCLIKLLKDPMKGFHCLLTALDYNDPAWVRDDYFLFIDVILI